MENPTQQFLESIDIHNILPQKEPFVMVGKLVHYSFLKTVTETTIAEDNIFVKDGFFNASGLVENVAQTCAARIGYYNKYVLKKGIQIGYIGAIKNFEITKFPKVGDTIITTIDVLQEVFQMTLATASISLNGEIIATSQMKIALD